MEGGAVVYEMDSVTEYAQIIGVVEHSVTFSSDLKKTEGYLKKCRKMIKAPVHKNYLIQEKNVNPRMFVKYQNAGLNEFVLEGASVKSLLYKINMFFTPFEQAAKKEEEAKNKALMSSMGLNSQSSNQEKEEYKSNERLRVEKTIDIDDNAGSLNQEKSHLSDTSDGAFDLEGEKNLKTKKTKVDQSFIESSFDNIKRKKVAQFEEQEQESKLKRNDFRPVEEEMQKSGQKSVDLKPEGELERKKLATFDVVEEELQKKRKKFEEHLSELKKKKIELDIVESDLKKKRSAFEEIAREMERKKGASFEDTEIGRKKKKQFDEFHEELKKKKKNLDLLEEDLKKKKKSFDEIESEMNKKSKELDQIDELEPQKKKGFLEELDELSKKRTNFIESVDDLEKKRKEFEEVVEDINKKKGRLEDLEEEESQKKKSNIEFEDLEKKKGPQFVEAEESSNDRPNFEELDVNLEKKTKGSGQEEEELNKKRGHFEEIEGEAKQRGNLVLDPVQAQRSQLLNEEVEEKNRSRSQEEFGETKEKKEYEEQVLDYKKFKEERKEGTRLKEEQEEQRRKQKELDELLDQPEYIFYENLSFGLEYLIIHSDFLMNETITMLDFFKFIHFALIKSFAGDISFYLVEDDSNETEAEINWKCLYSGHRIRKNPILDNNYEKYELSYIQEWLKKPIPTWRDETYQEEINEFVYPYFEEGILLGVAVAHFKNTVKDHHHASKVELLSLCLKGLMLNEYEKRDS